MSKEVVNRQLDRYLSNFSVDKVSLQFDRDNPEKEWEDIYNDCSIDEACILNGRVLS